MKIDRLAPLRSRLRLRWLLWSLLGVLLSLLGVHVVEAKVTSYADHQVRQLNGVLMGLVQSWEEQGKQAPEPKSPVGHLVEINGISLAYQTKSVELTEVELDQVFERLADRCQSPIETREEADSEPLVEAPTFSSGTPSERYLYCIRPRHPLTKTGLESSILAFNESGDLHDLGQLEGLYVRSSGRSRKMIMIQSQTGSLLKRAFPKESDAPGRDFAEFPRPTGRRTMSLQVNHQPALNIYELPPTPQSSAPRSNGKSALQNYAAQLGATGIKIIEAQPGLGSAGRSLVVQTERQSYLIFTHSLRETDAGASRQALSITRLVN